MGLFDAEKVNRVTDSVKKSTEQEIRKKNNSSNNIKQKKGNVGRPPIPESEKGKSYTVIMKKPLLEELESYREENFPDKSRSAVIVELLEEILEQKKN